MSKTKAETEDEVVVFTTSNVDIQSKIDDLETAVVQYKSLYEQEFATARRAEDLLQKWQQLPQFLVRQVLHQSYAI